jgi:hypothetical protein
MGIDALAECLEDDFRGRPWLFGIRIHWLLWRRPGGVGLARSGSS